MNFNKNDYPYNYFDFEYSQSVLNEYDLTSNNYYLISNLQFDNYEFTENIFFQTISKSIILSFLELKYLYDNLPNLIKDLKLIDNHKLLQLTFLNSLNRFEYFNNSFYFNIDLISQFLYNLPFYKNISKNDNTLITEINESVLDYFVIYYDYYEIIDSLNDTLNSISKLYNIDCYISNEFNIYLTSEIDLYNSTNNNSLNNEPETPNNTNADIGVTGEHKLSLKETKLLNETKLNYFAQIIKEYSNDNTTSYKNDCEIFTNYCNSKGIQNIHIRNKDKKMNAITLSNNSDKYGINNKNNIELTTLIHNILKNAF